MKRQLTARACAILLFAALAAPASAAESPPHPGTMVMASAHDYATLTERVAAAAQANGLGVVARASATLGARSIGVTIPGNMVIMVFHPRFAVRMLAASVSAGIEAPLRLYVTENTDGTATLTYRTPGSVFAPYGSAALDEMAAELDVIVARIARDAVGG